MDGGVGGVEVGGARGVVQRVCGGRHGRSGDAAGPGRQQVVIQQPGGARDKAQRWQVRVEAAGHRARVLGCLAGAKYASWLGALLWYLGGD